MLLKKLFIFARSQRLSTKAAVLTAVASLALAFSSLASSLPILMVVAGVASGFAAGLAIEALRGSNSQRKPPVIQTPDEQHSVTNHHHVQPV